MTCIKAAGLARAHTAAMTVATPPALPAASLGMLAAAPHRLLFLVGAANVLLAMAWWAFWLSVGRWSWFEMPVSPIPAGWAHAVVMQYQVLPPFMFGFLLTVFPRWMNLPPLTRWHYLPVGIGLLSGQALTLLGLLGYPLLLWLGLAQTLAGWLTGLFFLVSLLWREKQTTWHAVACAAALALGAVGLGLVMAYLHTGNARLMFAAIKFGSFGLLLPIYLTVAHRMFPFFAGVVVPGYQPYRPMPALAALWALSLAHLALELVHGYAWLWLADAPMAVLAAWLLWRWRVPRTAPLLLRVLFIGYGWLPLAMGLYAWQSGWFASTGAYTLGRAPAHALFIGFFGSLLVAMVTRVTQGHSGRVLTFGATALFAFALVQVIAVARIAAEMSRDPSAWYPVVAWLWLLAFLPWVIESALIYLRPRTDGKPG